VRSYAAIELRWPRRPDDGDLERLVAAFDDGTLTAVDDQGLVWRAFFDDAAARDLALAAFGPLPPEWQIRSVDVPDERWAERSQASIGPVRVGRLVVAPPWRARDPLTEAPGVDRVIVINPSMGFGTGHHASTRLCLSLLQAVPVRGRRVIDVGTGSGVLALAAWALGASSVDGIDTDPDAMASAMENGALNTAGDDVRFRQQDLRRLGPDAARSYDLVLGNLTGATLSAHASALAELGRPGSWLIASGIEVGEADDVIGALTAAGWHLTVREEEDGWVGLALERRATSPTASTGS